MDPGVELAQLLAVLRERAGVDKVSTYGDGSGALNATGARCRVALPADAGKASAG